jgi:transcriptional regulator with XRE-family HTH domain
MIGMHSTHISRYERNQVALSFEVAQKISKSIDIFFDTLIYGTMWTIWQKQTGR